MKTDTGTLMSLCEKTDNDIRACINTLQVGGSTMREARTVWMIKYADAEYVLACVVSSQPRAQAGGLEDDPECVCGAKGPEQRAVPSLARDLPVTAYETVRPTARVRNFME